MRFSHRGDWDAGLNELATLLEDLRSRNVPVVDLTASNPTRCGFAYPEAEIASALISDGIFTYEPDPRGLASARRVVSADVFAGAVSPEHLVLTASTSEAYAWVFKILCEAGDEVLVPAPSYPLLDFIAQGESVSLKRYPLAFDSEWHLDLAALEREITPRSRIVVVVQPNNPTGSFLSRAEIHSLREVCVRHELAIVSDEVFLEYGFDTDSPLVGRERSLLFPHPMPPDAPLTFVLGGLSKLAGLPQLKLSWIAVTGASADRDRALSRLELLGDTFLSVSTPVQRGVASILAATGNVRAQIRERTRNNLALLRERIGSDSPCRVLDPQGGWYALLRLPRLHADEEWARIFLDDDHVLVHPGSFFELAIDGFVVVSLLPPLAEFVEGVGKILARVDSEIGE